MIGSMHDLTHENLLLGEGILLRGTAAEELLATDAPEALLTALARDEDRRVGATKDGCVLRCVPRIVDLTRGRRTPAAGELLTAGWEVTLSGTLLEATGENLSLLLHQTGAADESLLWAGSAGAGLLLIELDAPLSSGGVTLRTFRQTPGEIGFALTMTHHAPDAAGLPLRLHRLKEETHD
ncbi:MAG: hypothetical protein IJ343_10800 [Clostridia bacterium]|nr:hypothetical protein [Clostridia bacterium]